MLIAINVVLRVLWLVLVAAFLWMIWSWYNRPLICETLESYPSVRSPDGALLAVAFQEACSDGGFQTYVRTAVAVGTDDAAARVPVLTIWETAKLRPAVLLSWIGPKMLDIGLVEPRHAELHPPTITGLSVRVTTEAANPR